MAIALTLAMILALAMTLALAISLTLAVTLAMTIALAMAMTLAMALSLALHLYHAALTLTLSHSCHAWGRFNGRGSSTCNIVGRDRRRSKSRISRSNSNDLHLSSLGVLGTAEVWIWLNPNLNPNWYCNFP